LQHWIPLPLADGVIDWFKVQKNKQKEEHE
jgi:hypothetical protein